MALRIEAWLGLAWRGPWRVCTGVAGVPSRLWFVAG